MAGAETRENTAIEHEIFELFDRYTELPSELLTSPLMESKKDGEVAVVSDGMVSSPEELLASTARYLVLSSLQLTDAKDRVTTNNILIDIAKHKSDEDKFVKKVIYQRGVRLKDYPNAMGVAHEKARLKIYEIAGKFGVADALFLEGVGSYIEPPEDIDPDIDWDNINTEAELEEVLKEEAFRK